MNKWIRIIVIVIALAVMIFSGYKLYETLHSYNVAENAYGDTAGQFVKKKTGSSESAADSSNMSHAEQMGRTDNGTEDVSPVSGEEQSESYIYSEEGAFDWSGYAAPAPIEVDFETLVSENSDVMGWIYSEDTPINYPVMQGENNASYLHHLPDGTSNFAGSIFIEQNNSPDLSDVNTILYGHSMKNGTMFGTIINYGKQSYYNEHPTLWYLTPYGDYRLDAVMGITVPADIDLYNVYYDIESYREVLRKYESKSTFDSGISIDELDQVITLSTCSKAFDNARYVLICRVVPCIPDWANE